MGDEEIIMTNGSKLFFDGADDDVEFGTDVGSAITHYGRSILEGSYSFTRDTVEYQGRSHYIIDKNHKMIAQGIRMLVLDFKCGRKAQINPDRYRQFYQERTVKEEDEPAINICPGCATGMEEICRL